MSRFELINPNIVKIIMEMLNNEKICQLIKHNYDTPFDTPVSTPSLDLLNTFVFPYPFNPSTLADDRTELHIHIPRFEFKNNVIEDSYVQFDVVLSKNVWMIHDESGNPILRPQEIMKHIINHFGDKSIDTIGRLHFTHGRYVVWNDNYNGFELYAKMMTIGK